VAAPRIFSRIPFRLSPNYPEGLSIDRGSAWNPPERDSPKVTKCVTFTFKNSCALCFTRRPSSSSVKRKLLRIRSRHLRLTGLVPPIIARVKMPISLGIFHCHRNSLNFVTISRFPITLNERPEERPFFPLFPSFLDSPPPRFLPTYIYIYIPALTQNMMRAERPFHPRCPIFATVFYLRVVEHPELF